MVKDIAAVISVPIVWGFIMFPGNLLLYQFFPGAMEGDFTTTFLVLSLLFSVIYSLGSGAFAGVLSSARWMGIAAGVALLAVGVPVQIMNWDLIPVWYHVLFLAALIPAAMAGVAITQRFRADDKAAGVVGES